METKEFRNDKEYLDVKHKISVFISSCCDESKYNPIRHDLSEKLKKTGLFDVYCFEEEGSSTLSAEEHYRLALRDCDVVIFLIDNADGVPEGVLKEINDAKKFEKKALFYFCTEQSKKPTLIQHNLTGPQASKYSNVEKFKDLPEQGFQGLLNDISLIYHYYCKNPLSIHTKEDENNIETTDVFVEKLDSAIPKEILELPKTAEKLLYEALGESYVKNNYLDKHQSKLDIYAENFLHILFNSLKVDEFNWNGFIDELKKEEFLNPLLPIIEIRFEVIKNYFKGNLDACIDKTEQCLKLAREQIVAKWFEKDLLIDLRNLKIWHGDINNTIEYFEVQNTLNEDKEALYYPVLDRFSYNFNERCMKNLYKDDIASPYTSTIGSTLDLFGKQLASIFVVALCHGSLSQLLMIYDHMQTFTYYLSCRYNNWSIQRNLLKFAIFNGKNKDVDGLLKKYPLLTIQMSAEDASQIMDFTNNQPISYRRYKSQLIGIGAVGYFLSDNDFEQWSTIIFSNTYQWLDSLEACSSVGNLIIRSVEKIQGRVPTEKIISLTMSYFKKRVSRWYGDLFKLIGNTVNINKIKTDKAQELINEICCIIKDDTNRDRGYINNLIYLASWRVQNKDLTEDLDKLIQSVLPDFNKKQYLLNSVENVQKQMPDFVDYYLTTISRNNEVQGQNGCYMGKISRDYYVLRNILMDDNYKVSKKELKRIVSVASDTFLKSNETIAIKTDALEMLLFIVLKYDSVVEENNNVFNTLQNTTFDSITYWDDSEWSNNLELISLKLAYKLLMLSLGKKETISIIDILTNPGLNDRTQLRCLEVITNYVEWVKKPIKSEIIPYIAMYTIDFLKNDIIQCRLYATRIILNLVDMNEYRELANRQIIDRIDNDNFLIKNLIQRNLDQHKGINESTKDYVIKQCSIDGNYLVRNCMKIN